MFEPGLRDRQKAAVVGNDAAGAALRRRPLPKGLGALALSVVLLAGCVSQASAPAPTALPPPPVAAGPDAAETEAARAYYRQLQDRYRERGLLRTDGGGRDTPFNARNLADSFLQIAFFDEFTERGSRLVAASKESTLHRWQSPVRVAVVFGDQVAPAQQSADRAYVTRYFSTLAGLTGLSIAMTEAQPNFVVYVGNPAERRMLGPALTRFAPGTSAAALASATNLTPDIYCTVFSYSPGHAPTYTQAFAVIRAELPDLMRRACFDEELAQGLGLVNDSPTARPSIFNDDQEFAALTVQDRLFLRMLYDRRLRPGMTLEEARPVVERMAAELTGEAI